MNITADSYQEVVPTFEDRLPEFVADEVAPSRRSDRHRRLADVVFVGAWERKRRGISAAGQKNGPGRGCLAPDR